MSGHNSNNCIACGAALYNMHSHAKFCSARCRKRWSRRKEIVNREYFDAQMHVKELVRLMNQYPDLQPDIVGKLRQVRQYIANILLMSDPQTQEENAVINQALMSQIQIGKK